MAFKQIMVRDEVHGKLRRIAKANKRTIAGQVEFLLEASKECTHPLEMREQLVIVDSAAEGQPSRSFVLCRRCNRLIS